MTVKTAQAATTSEADIDLIVHAQPLEPVLGPGDS